MTECGTNSTEYKYYKYNLGNTEIYFISSGKILFADFSDVCKNMIIHPYNEYAFLACQIKHLPYRL